MTQRVAVVIPMFNEVRHVVGVLERMPREIDFIVVVDDASTDGSRIAVAELASARVLLAGHTRREGVGAALQTGYRLALENGAEVIVTMDADGQMDPDDLPALLAPILLGEASYAKGNRFHPSASLVTMPWIRRVANSVISRFCALVLGDADLRDAHCGYTAASREIVTALLDARFHASYGVYNDLLAKVLSMPGSPVQYVPVRALYADETSHLRCSDLPKLAFLLMRLAFRSMRVSRPSLPRSDGGVDLLAETTSALTRSRDAHPD